MQCDRLINSNLFKGFFAGLVAIIHLSGTFTVSANESENNVIHVDVYYEALCIDSVNFIKNQLTPVYPELKEHLDITFVPYGKASHWWDSESKSWKFTCQHGPRECEGNKVQSCAIHEIESLDGDQFNRQQLMVDLVNCAMTSRQSSTACPQKIGLPDQTQKEIKDCIEGTLSNDLLVANGNKTAALDPPLTFVPTIVVNNNRNQINQNAALKNFKKLICDLLPEVSRPKACTRND